MSQENVELVPAAYAAFNRGDFDAVAAALHPDVEWHPYLGGLERTVYLNAYPTSNVLTLRLSDQVSASSRPLPGRSLTQPFSTTCQRDREGGGGD